jgi:iron complex transport system substrate-binding protein
MGLQPVGTVCILDDALGTSLRGRRSAHTHRHSASWWCAAACWAWLAVCPVTTSAAPVAAAAPATAAPRTVIDDRGRHIAVPARVQRVVSLLPSLTESVCALGACDRLVGVDRSSDWPASVRTLPQLGGLEDPAIERIVALRPDLVLVPLSWRASSRLESAGLTVLAMEPGSMMTTRRMLSVLASALGTPDAAEPLWQTVRGQLEQAAAQVPASWRGARAYVEVSDVPHAAGERSTLGEIVAALGLRNIVPADLGLYPQLNPEFVVRANPDLVIGSQDAVSRMRARPGWSQLAALQQAHVCGLSPRVYDTVVRAGPRMGEAAQALVQCLQALPVRAGTLSR